MELKEKIIAEIKKIYDPEIPVNIYELGLIYDVKIENNNSVKVKMTLTTPNVLTLAEISIAIVPEDADGVGPFCCHGQIIETVTIEIADCDVQRITICGV